MTKDELTAHLAALNLTALEAAKLLGLSAGPLRREVPAPAEAALRAWRALHERNLPWKPDSVSIFDNDRDQIERHLRHSQELEGLLTRVERRGGPKDPWTVDLSRKTATFGSFEVQFYHLQNEGILAEHLHSEGQSARRATRHGTDRRCGLLYCLGIHKSAKKLRCFKGCRRLYAKAFVRFRG